jgi:hypothetical protein
LNGVPDHKATHIFALVLAVTLKSDLSESTGTVDATAVAGMYHVYSGDFAPCGGMVSIDGVDCPEAGAYKFAYDYQLPDQGSAWYANMAGLFGIAITVKAIFDFGDSQSTTCTMTITASQNSGYQMSTVSFVGGAILLVGVAAIGLKKRRAATIQLQEGEGSQSHFEMMRNDAAVQV